MIKFARCNKPPVGCFPESHWKEDWRIPFNLFEPVCHVCYKELLKVRQKVKDFETDQMRKCLDTRTAPKETPND